MKRELINPIVDEWLALLEPVTTRREVAGSYRRGKDDCKDLEIVVIPRYSTDLDLFGHPRTSVNLLEEWFAQNNTGARFFFTKNGTRYKQLSLLKDIKLDLFIVRPPAQWGVQFAIRTGPADFSHWLVSAHYIGGALPSGYQVKDGALWHNGEVVPTPEETDFFNAIGLPWLEPHERVARWRR